MSDNVMTYEDWLRGCVYHDGRKGYVCLPCDEVLKIADWIEAHRLCTDGRFEVIARAKEDLLRCTNIDTSPSEMAVLDEILFRCWQMGWLDKYEDKETDNHCEDCQDIVIADEAYAEYKANPKTYTLGEIIEMNDPCEDCQEFNCDYCPNRRARME